MSLGISPLFFNQLPSTRLIAPMQVKNRVGKTVLPVIQKLGTLPSTRSCLPSANKEYTFDDASYSLRAFNDGIHAVSPGFSGLQGGSFVGLTTISYAGIGAAQVYNNYKKSVRAEKIGDQEGARLAKLEAAENVFLTAGSVVIIPLRGISMAQDIFQAVKHTPLTLTPATSLTQSVFSWASVVLFGIFYAIKGIKSGWALVNWYQGRSWRQELLESDNPVKSLMGQLQKRVQAIDLKPEELKKLALDAGVRWLGKVAEEAKKNGIELNFQDPALAFEHYIQRHPEMIENLLGRCPIRLTPKEELIRLGRYLAIQNECAKFEAECQRKLGSKAVEALKTQDTSQIKEALSANEGVILAIKVALAVVGFAALIAATLFTGGLGLGIVLGLYGLGGLISIYLEDWGALKEHLEKGELRKRDRLFIYFSTILSFLAMIGLVTISVISGGALIYLGGLILTSAWLIINLRACTMVVGYNLRPWMTQQPTIKAFRMLLGTGPSQEVIQSVLEKMSIEHQAAVSRILKDHTDVNQVVQALKKLEEAIDKHHQEDRQRLLDDLKPIMNLPRDS